LSEEELEILPQTGEGTSRAGKEYRGNRRKGKGSNWMEEKGEVEEGMERDKISYLFYTFSPAATAGKLLTDGNDQ